MIFVVPCRLGEPRVLFKSPGAPAVTFLGVAARRGSVALLVRAAVLAQTQFHAAEVRGAWQGLVPLVVPLLAAVPVAAPGTPLAVGRGVAIRNLVHAEALLDPAPVLKEENNH